MKLILRFTLLICAVSRCLCINLGATPCGSVKGTIQRLYDNYNISVSENTVHISCIHDSTLIGNENVTCLQNGKWDPQFPKCAVNCPAIPELPLIFTKDTVTYVKTTNNDRYAGITISLSCVTHDYIIDGSSTITCQSNRKWNPEIPSCKPKPEPPDKRWLLILAITGPAGLLLTVGCILIGKALLRYRKQKDERKEVIQMSDMLNTDSFYKVWTVDRGRKKLISATDIKKLIQKASAIFDINNERHAQLVLEEDGTEVTTSSAMALSHDKTFTILGKDQSWKPVTATENEMLKLTFDVCSADRSKRKLFLAANLDELLDQVKNSFGSEQSCLCLETDGTIIDDNSSLFAVAGHQIMSLRDTNDWRGVTSRVVQQLDFMNEAKKDQSRPTNCYKVWTEDQRCKKIIFADDLLDLHIKASRILSLRSPIQISVLDINTVITDNEQLHHHQNNILVATEAYDVYDSAPPSIYSNRDDRFSNDYVELPVTLHQPSSRRTSHNKTYF